MPARRAPDRAARRASHRSDRRLRRAASASAELQIDRALLDKHLGEIDKLREVGALESRLGDQRAKALLKAYGAPVTRQGLATTPSAAVNIARKVGFPVEVKPHADELATEPAGCPVERGVTSDARVRQAYAVVLSAVPAAAGAVIVRETPPAGRELAVSLTRLPALGWTVVLELPGGQIAAAPAPLRLVDAKELAAQVVASRAGEPEPDRTGLANLMRRASHLVVDLDRRLARLELARVVIGGRGARTLVVDAYAELT